MKRTVPWGNKKTRSEKQQTCITYKSRLVAHVLFDCVFAGQLFRGEEKIISKQTKLSKFIQCSACGTVIVHNSSQQPLVKSSIVIYLWNLISILSYNPLLLKKGERNLELLFCLAIFF